MQRLPIQSQSNTRPIAVDVFSGVGGLSLGFEQAGFDIVAAIEYDPIHAAVHQFNFPQTSIICADICDEQKVSAKALETAVRQGLQNHGRNATVWDGEVDVVFGGPPCQGFSTIGKRDATDARNKLVFQFARIVEILRPGYVIMENVSGMTLQPHSKTLTAFIKQLRRAGYHIQDEPELLNAKDFGVPQDRRRVFFLASRKGRKIASYPEPKPTENQSTSTAKRSGKRHKTNIKPIGPTVWDAIGDLSSLDRRASLYKVDEITLTPNLQRKIDLKASRYAATLRGTISDSNDFSYKRVWNQTSVTNSMLTVHEPAVVRRFAKTPKGMIEPRSHFHRLHPKGLCSTLRAGTGSEHGGYTSARPIHPNKPRVITVREAARLQSFPDWFRFHRTKWHGFRQVGNSVPPLLGRAIASSIIVAMNHAPQRPTRILQPGDATLLEMNYSEAAKYFGVAEKREGHHRRKSNNAREGTRTSRQGAASGARRAA